MLPTAASWKQKFDELKRQRAPLFAEFEKSPYNLPLALKIKAIDDEMAACSESMSHEKRRR